MTKLCVLNTLTTSAICWPNKPAARQGLTPQHLPNTNKIIKLFSMFTHHISIISFSTISVCKSCSLVVDMLIKHNDELRRIQQCSGIIVRDVMQIGAPWDITGFSGAYALCVLNPYAGGG